MQRWQPAQKGDGVTNTAHQPRSVVLIHGTPLGPSVWDPVVTGLKHRRVVVPDCRKVPAHNAQATLAAQIASAVSGGLDIVGHSFGGQIAIELALRAARRVHSLTIVCSRDSPFPAFALTSAQLRAGQLPSAEVTLGRWFTAADLASDGSAVKRARRDLEQASVVDWAAALDAIADYDASSRTPGIRIPTTIIGAGLDTVSAPEAVRAMADRIPDSVLDLHDDWTHMSPFVRPGKLARIIEAAIDSNP